MSVGYLIEVERSARSRSNEAPRTKPDNEAWLSSILLRLQANRLLNRTLRSGIRRSRLTRIDELSPYLLKDIGLPPDIR